MLSFSDITNKTKRAYVSEKDKIQISKLVPEDLQEDIIGALLGDGTLRYNGKNALLGIQQTHQEITEYLWDKCFKANLIKSEIFIIERKNKQTVYSFQTLTLPYFNTLYSEWYHYIGDKRFKKLPDNISKLLTDRTLTMFIMMDGSWDQGKRGLGRLNLHTNFLTYTEVKTLQEILKTNYDIDSYLNFQKSSQPDRGYLIRISGKDIFKIKERLLPYILPGLKYKLGIKA